MAAVLVPSTREFKLVRTSFKQVIINLKQVIHVLTHIS